MILTGIELETFEGICCLASINEFENFTKTALTLDTRPARHYWQFRQELRIVTLSKPSNLPGFEPGIS